MLAVASIEVNACSHSIVHPAVLKVQGLGGVVYFSVSKYRSVLFIEDVKGVVRPVPKGVQPVHLHRAPKNVGPPN